MSEQSPASDPPRLSRTVLQVLGATSVIFGAGRILQLAYLAILARLLTPGEFGVAAGATLVVTLVQLISTFGIGVTIVQAPHMPPRTIAVARMLTLATGTACAGAVFLGAPLAALWFGNPQLIAVVRVMAVIVLAQGLAVIPIGWMMRQFRARALGIVDVASAFVGTALIAIPMAYAHLGYWALVAGQVAAAVIRVLLLLVWSRMPLALAIDASISKRLLIHGGGFSLATVLTHIGLEADRLIVGRFLPQHDLGLYSRASSLMSMPSTLYSQVVERVVMPAYARVQDFGERLRTAYLRAVSLTAILGLPAVVVFIALAPQLIETVLGPQWIEVATPTRILGAALYFQVAVRVGASMLRGVGRPYSLALIQAAHAVLVVGGCLFAVRWGLAGIAAASVVAITVNSALIHAVAARRAGVSLGALLAAHVPGLACALVATAAMAPWLWLLNAFPVPSPIALLGGSALAFAACLGAALLAPRLFLGPTGLDLLADLKAILLRKPPTAAERA